MTVLFVGIRENWDLWLGDQMKTRRRFDAEDYFRWRKYYRYSAGVDVPLICRSLFPLMIAMGKLDFPVRVGALGNKKFHTDAAGQAPERDCPEIFQLMAEFPDGAMLYLMSGSVNEQGVPWKIMGHKASLSCLDDGLALTPEKPFVGEVAPEHFGPFQEGEDPEAHFKNWIESIYGRAKPVTEIELSVRAQTVLSLAEMSERLGMVCLFDEATRTVRDGFGQEFKPLYYG